MGIEVRSPGISTTVQDAGREGYYHVGVPPAGALDQYSFMAANLLVGNPLHFAALECTYTGPELTFGKPATVAVCGAELKPEVEGQPRPAWAAFDVSPGETLAFGLLGRGTRVYIAVSGGISVPDVLGSRSTYMLGGLGGFQGRALQAGDVLEMGRRRSDRRRAGACVPDELRARLPSQLEIRVVMGLYDHLLTPDGRHSFVETEWKLTPLADRVGLRYSGASLELRTREQPFGAGQDPSNIVDAPYPIGAIQIPGGVEPIVLHRDAVSAGGYATIATVISADMDLLAQAAPGSTARFVPVGLDHALAARAQRRQRLEELYRAVNQNSSL